ncbi:MAG: alpha-L-fucosidase [Saprospiraceae bacterium]
MLLIQRLIFGILLLSFLACGVSEQPLDPPAAFGAVPSQRQLEWHKLKYYGFVHFSPNTFTNKEWGYGNESPESFNPSSLDVEQWARIFKDAGMEGIIITAKHHDGFCLWPSEYTEHSIKNSPYKNGEGDIIQELREACDNYDLKLGIYLSPWDRNHPDYGTPKYLTYFRNQLTELLTNYGDIYEVWFDGANGGDGYYGGANEIRKIDNSTYYDWENTHSLVRKLQPNAIMFSDAGPDARWIGNEHGYSYDPTWSTINSEGLYPGMLGKNKNLQHGDKLGSKWIGPEVNTSIRPGWFHHPEENNDIKSVNRLVDNWFHSVGMNGNFLLNVPPDSHGKIHDKDSAVLMGLKAYIDDAFRTDLTVKARYTASNTRGQHSEFSPRKAFDQDPNSYWATDKDTTTANLTIEFPETTSLNTVLLQEYIALGQRIESFTIEANVNGVFTKVASGETIGNRRLIKFKTLSTDALRITFDGLAEPVISNIEVYKIRKLLGEPQILRDKAGNVTISSDSEDPMYRYTLDRSPPNVNSLVYNGPFAFTKPGVVSAVAVLPEGGETSAIVSQIYDVAKTDWTITANRDNELWHPPTEAIDDNPNSLWKALPQKEGEAPTQLVIDLGSIHNVEGVTYLPARIDIFKANVLKYRLETALRKNDWQIAKVGFFDVLTENPTEQFIPLPEAAPVRYLRFTSLQDVGDSGRMQVAEIGIKTKSS